MRENITYVAMDTHKKEHHVAMVLPGSEEVSRWSVLNRAAEIRKLVKRVQKQAPGPIEFCYEAGPCGFDLMRQIEAQGVKCQVIAPSMTPHKPGERVKTDRRDALKLLEYQRGGMLTEVHPPNEQEEAIRDLCRCRETVREDLVRAKHRLLKLSLIRIVLFLLLIEYHPLQQSLHLFLSQYLENLSGTNLNRQARLERLYH